MLEGLDAFRDPDWHSDTLKTKMDGVAVTLKAFLENSAVPLVGHWFWIVKKHFLRHKYTPGSQRILWIRSSYRDLT